jgi:hypothetical protein
MLAFSFCRIVYADPRTEYLINLLKNGESYRVKVQAAQTLGRIKAKAAVPALIDALADNSDEVVIASSSALGEIGDASALKPLQKTAQLKKSKAVKSQLMAAIRLLDTSDTDKVSPGKLRYIVKVDAMGNSSGHGRSDISDIMKKTVELNLQKRQGLELLQSGIKEEALKKRLLQSGSKSFIVSGSLLKLQHDSNYVEVGIALNVFTNPGYSLLMMPSGEIRVPVDSSKSKVEAENDAIALLIDNLIGNILDAVADAL